MKRIVSWMLSIAMMLSVCALAAEGDLIVARTENGPLQYGVESSCGAGDALYFLLYSGNEDSVKKLGVHHVGETEMKQYGVQLGDVTENNAYENSYMFSDGEKVYILQEVGVYTDDSQDTSDNLRENVSLYEITIEGEKAEAKLICEPDWSFFKSGSEYNYVSSVMGVKDYGILIYYNEIGETKIAKMKLADGTFEECSFEGELISAIAYVDGQILIQQYTDDARQRVRFLSYDPAADCFEEVLEVDVPEYEHFDGLACDMENGKVYYTKQGEIFELNMQTGEQGEAITDMPESMYSNVSAVVLQGGYYAFASYDCYMIRNLHPAQRPSERLKIYDGSGADCVSQAVYEFTNEHDDTAVILSRDYNSANSLVDDMMKRSNDIDVYVMDASSAEYESVFKRGYIAELTGSEKMQVVAERMYPAMREALSVNGELCAMPVYFYFWLPYLQESALEKLNMTVEDVPTNWSDFLDFLMELPEKMPADGSVTLMEAWTSDEGAKQIMFDRLFTDYQQLLKKDPNAFSEEQMIEILEKLDKVDFQALGQPAEEEIENEDFVGGGDNCYLLELNMGTTLSGISRQYPMVMSMTADTPKMLVVSGMVAFINPYSENREKALEFMEKLTENLPDDTNYTMFSDLNEPVPNSYYEEEIASMQKNIESLRTRYETAEAIDKQDIQEQLETAEQNLEEYKKYQYSISEKEIEWIHEYGDALTIQGNNWLYSSDAGDAYQLIREYSEGQIDARKLMNEIGRKIRMMMMEQY